MELSGYEILTERRIAHWEETPAGGLPRKLQAYLTRPVEDLIGAFGHKQTLLVERAVTHVIHDLISASAYTIRPEELLKRAQRLGIRLQHFSEIKTCDLRLLDRCNRQNIDLHALTSTVQGALMGLAGPVLAPADLVVVLGTTFHLMQEISSCHGFHPDDPMEKEIMLHILEMGIGPPEQKERALSAIEELKARARAGDTSGVLLDGGHLNVFASKALSEFIQNLTVSLGCRILAHCLPVLSMITGAHSNHELVSDCGLSAFMVYRKLFLERKRTL